MRAAVLLGILLVCAAITRAESPCAARTFEGSRFMVCAFDARRDAFQLAWRDEAGWALRTFDGLARMKGFDAARVRFAMNAGMYEQSGRPLGLFVANGRSERAIRTDSGRGNFHLKPNGVFLIDAAGRPQVMATARYLREHRRRGENVPRWATQSGPMLVVDGKLHPSFQPDGQSRLIRNGVGVPDATSALFVISDDAVSFGKMARFFRDDLKCRNALYLDGVVSSLWAPSLGRKDVKFPLGPILVVSEARR